MKYRWGSRFGFNKIPAQVAGEAIENLRKGNRGRVTPSMLLEAARDESHPLHPAFDWEDTEAAEKWRLHQAQSLLVSVIVVAHDDGTKKITTNAFVRVSTRSGPAYTTIEHAMGDDAMREEVVSRALGEARAWEARYRRYAELADICAAIRKVAKRRPRRGA